MQKMFGECEKILPEIEREYTLEYLNFLGETLNFVMRKVKMFWNIMAIALAPTKTMKVAKKSKVSRNP